MIHVNKSDFEWQWLTKYVGILRHTDSQNGKSYVITTGYDEIIWRCLFCRDTTQEEYQNLINRILWVCSI